MRFSKPSPTRMRLTSRRLEPIGLFRRSFTMVKIRGTLCMRSHIFSLRATTKNPVKPLFSGDMLQGKGFQS
jgi:hypothetical protein